MYLSILTALKSHVYWVVCRADSRFAPSQWETVLLCNKSLSLAGRKPSISPEFTIPSFDICQNACENLLTYPAVYLCEVNVHSEFLNQPTQLNRSYEKDKSTIMEVKQIIFMKKSPKLLVEGSSNFRSAYGCVDMVWQKSWTVYQLKAVKKYRRHF